MFKSAVLYVSLFAAAGLAQAAQPLASTTATIENLRYHLIDLDPSDGISPSMRLILEDEHVQASKTLMLDTTQITTNWQQDNGKSLPIFGTPFSSEAITLTNSRTVASKTDHGFQSQGRIELDDLSLSEAMPWMAGRDPFTLAFNSASAGSGVLWFELSAHTGLVVEGVAKLHNTIELDELRNSDIGRFAAAQAGRSISLNTNTLVEGSLETFGGNEAPRFQDGFVFENVLTMSTDGSGFSKGPFPREEVFSMKMDNDRDNFVKVSMRLVASTSQFATMSPVPEPATHILLGLGVLGIVCAVRHRRGNTVH